MSKLSVYTFLLFCPLFICSMEKNPLVDLAKNRKSVTFSSNYSGYPSDTQLTSSSGEEKKTFIPVNTKSKCNKRSMSEKNRVILKTKDGVITKESADKYFKENGAAIDNAIKKNRAARDLWLKKRREFLVFISLQYHIKFEYILGLMECVKNLQEEGLYIDLNQEYGFFLAEKQEEFVYMIENHYSFQFEKALQLYMVLDKNIQKLPGYL